MREWSEKDAPNIETSGTVAVETITVEMYQKNPVCIRCTHGGKVFEICR